MAIVKGKDDFDKMPTIGGTDPIVPTGGTIGQVLTKDSGTDYDYSWQDSGGGDVSAASSMSDNSIVRGDGGVKGVQDSAWSITDNGVLTSGFSYAGYIIDVHNTKADGGGNGFRIKAGELAGDVAFHVADTDDTFQIMEMEADKGYVTMGKTYSQTLTDNGVVYGLDIQHSTSPGNADFNTQNGTYRIGGVDVALPTGGTTGQVLEKASGTNYDVQWADASGGFIKSAFAEITSDTTTTTTTWGTTLLSINITPASSSNYFIVNFSVSGWNSSSSDRRVQFRLSMGLTGSETVRRATHFFSDDNMEAGSASLVYRAQAVGAGQHTVLIEWKSSSSGTAEIQVVTEPDDHHASLLVQEVTG